MADFWRRAMGMLAGTAETGVTWLEALVRRGGTLRFDQPCMASAGRPSGMVVAYHPVVRQIGEAVLDAGGNAFDAFIAAVAAENVVSEGASTLAGPLAALVYRAAEDRVDYFDAAFNDPLDPAGAWSLDHPDLGRAVLVPGAPAGLAELAKLARIPFAELLTPAIALAEQGFEATRLMAAYTAERREVLASSDYGRRTYLRRGRPLRGGETIRLPEVAEFLRGLATEGPDYVYRGAWGQAFLTEVQAQGGCLTEADLEHYAIEWHEPWSATYRGHVVHSSSGRSFGGLWVLLALTTREAAGLPSATHYSVDAQELADMVSVARTIWAEPDLFDAALLGNRTAMQSRLDTAHGAQRLAEMLDSRPRPATPPPAGPHSFQIITLDGEGNVCNGTTTGQSELWGDGLFVSGLPLTSAGRIPFNTAPGERRISPFSHHIVRREGQLWLALGTISNSIVESAFQLLVNVLDYGASLEEAVLLPRFGTFPPIPDSPAPVPDIMRNWMDPRLPRSALRELRARGVVPVSRRPVDTGLGAMLRVEPDGPQGITLPIPYLTDPFGTRPG